MLTMESSFLIVGPVAVGGPRTVTALLGADNITLSDVMFGDVWVCSGQSNMQFQLSEVFAFSHDKFIF